MFMVATASAPSTRAPSPYFLSSCASIAAAASSSALRPATQSTGASARHSEPSPSRLTLARSGSGFDRGRGLGVVRGFVHRLAIALPGQVVDHLEGRGFDLLDLRTVERAARNVVLRELEGGQRHLVVV